MDLFNGLINDWNIMINVDVSEYESFRHDTSALIGVIFNYFTNHYYLSVLLQLFIKYSIELILCCSFIVICVIIAWMWRQYQTLAKKKGVQISLTKFLQNLPTFPIFFIYGAFSVIKIFLLKETLKWRQNSFLCMLSGQDQFFYKECNKHTVVPILLLVSFKGSAKDFFYHFTHHFWGRVYALNQQHKIFGKISTSNESCFITRNSDTDYCNYIKKLELPNKKVVTKAELLLKIEECYAEDLPDSNLAFWQILVGTNVVNWPIENTGNKKLYPIILKFTHSLTDAENVMHIIMNMFASPSDEIKNDVKVLPILNKFKKRCGFLEYLCKGIILKTVNSSMLSLEKNILFERKPLGIKKYLCIDSVAVNYLDKINFIYNNAPFETTKNCILETAIIESISNYLIKNSDPANTPASLIYVTTLVDDMVSSTRIHSEPMNRSEACRSNIGFMYLKSSISKKPFSLKTLKNNSKQKKYCERFGEVEICQKFTREVYNNFNDRMKNTFLGNTNYCSTTLISELVGPNHKIEINDSMIVEDIYGWCPNFGKTGIGFALCTYLGKPRLTLNIDQGLVKTKADAQSILTGVYKLLNVMVATIKENWNKS